MVKIITVVRDYSTYERFVRHNVFCKCAEFVDYDNRSENVPIPVRYNSFIDSYDFSKEDWLIFCHEDFEIAENLSDMLKTLDEKVLVGVVGGVRKGLVGFGMQVIYGNMTEKVRGSDAKVWNAGRQIKSPIEVDAFDCCCLIVHSSLVKRYGLRFDEKLEFDLYVEDFCASAKVNHGVASFVYPVKCCHHSGSIATERLYRHLPYLRHKYPRNCFVGTLTYFGTPDWCKRFQDFVMEKARPIVGALHRMVVLCII